MRKQSELPQSPLGLATQQNTMLGGTNLQNTGPGTGAAANAATQAANFVTNKKENLAMQTADHNPAADAILNPGTADPNPGAGASVAPPPASTVPPPAVATVPPAPTVTQTGGAPVTTPPTAHGLEPEMTITSAANDACGIAGNMLLDMDLHVASQDKLAMELNQYADEEMMNRLAAAALGEMGGDICKAAADIRDGMIKSSNAPIDGMEKSAILPWLARMAAGAHGMRGAFGGAAAQKARQQALRTRALERQATRVEPGVFGTAPSVQGSGLFGSNFMARRMGRSDVMRAQRQAGAQSANAARQAGAQGQDIARARAQGRLQFAKDFNRISPNSPHMGALRRGYAKNVGGGGAAGGAAKGTTGGAAAGKDPLALQPAGGGATSPTAAATGGGAAAGKADPLALQPATATAGPSLAGIGLDPTATAAIHRNLSAARQSARRIAADPAMIPAARPGAMAATLPGAAPGVVGTTGAGAADRLKAMMPTRAGMAQTNRAFAGGTAPSRPMGNVNAAREAARAAPSAPAPAAPAPAAPAPAAPPPAAPPPPSAAATPPTPPPAPPAAPAAAATPPPPPLPAPISARMGGTPPSGLPAAGQKGTSKNMLPSGDLPLPGVGSGPAAMNMQGVTPLNPGARVKPSTNTPMSPFAAASNIHSNSATEAMRKTAAAFLVNRPDAVQRGVDHILDVA
jgi:hypothetical protein